MNSIIKNNGRNEADSFSVFIYDDINVDSTGSENELLYSEDFINLKSNDSLEISTGIDSLEEKNYHFLIKVDF